MALVVNTAIVFQLVDFITLDTHFMGLLLHKIHVSFGIAIRRQVPVLFKHVPISCNVQAVLLLAVSVFLVAKLKVILPLVAPEESIVLTNVNEEKGVIC